MDKDLRKPAKEHQLQYPQDARYVYVFPASNGKLQNDTTTREMVKSDMTIIKQIRRNTIVTTW